MVVVVGVVGVGRVLKLGERVGLGCIVGRVWMVIREVRDLVGEVGRVIVGVVGMTTVVGTVMSLVGMTGMVMVPECPRASCVPRR